MKFAKKDEILEVSYLHILQNETKQNITRSAKPI